MYDHMWMCVYVYEMFVCIIEVLVYIYIRKYSKMLIQ